MHFVLSPVLFVLSLWDGRFLVFLFFICPGKGWVGASSISDAIILLSPIRQKKDKERCSNLNYFLLNLTRSKRRREGKITPDLHFWRIGILTSGAVEDFNILLTIIKKNSTDLLPSKFVYSSLVPILFPRFNTRRPCT